MRIKFIYDSIVDSKVLMVIFFASDSKLNVILPFLLTGRMV